MYKNKIIICLVIILITVLALMSNKTKVYSPADTSHDGTYLVNGQPVTLKGGLSEIKAAPESASKIITRYFGNEVRHDFDGDGREDSVFLVTQEGGGSGTFYYVVARLDRPNGPVGSQALFLGDRIAPQSTEMGKGNIVIVNYADRKPSESFSVPPSFGKSIWLLLDPKLMQFGEVVQNFEGETACTMDAKMCPDGSYVGRSGKNCEFVCPSN